MDKDFMGALCPRVLTMQNKRKKREGFK